MTEGRLNTDIAGGISHFQSVMKSFELKTKLYRTIIKGKGLEFDGYKEYTVSDDSSSIDWKASKRANQLLTKQYIEEQNLKVVFIIDVGENMVFGSSEKLKCEYAAEVVASLANLIIESGNRVGYIFFSENVREFVRPARGKKHFGRFVDSLTDASKYGGKSHFGNAIDFALKYIDKSVSSIVLVSDFIRIENTFNEKLPLISNRFETMALMIKDNLDRTLPDVSGELIIENSVTGERILINPSLAKGSYEKYAAEQEIFVRNILRQNRVDVVELMTDKPFASSLATFLRERTRSLKSSVSL